MLVVMSAGSALAQATKGAAPAGNNSGPTMELFVKGIGGADMHTKKKPGGDITNTRQSGTDGKFRFDNLEPGTYAIVVEMKDPSKQFLEITIEGTAKGTVKSGYDLKQKKAVDLKVENNRLAAKPRTETEILIEVTKAGPVTGTVKEVSLRATQTSSGQSKSNND